MPGLLYRLRAQFENEGVSLQRRLGSMKKTGIVPRPKSTRRRSEYRTAVIRTMPGKPPIGVVRTEPRHSAGALSPPTRLSCS